MCFFLLKDQADPILADQNVLILNCQNESKVRVVILCYVPGGCSKWYKNINLKFGLFLQQMLSVTSYRSFKCY